MAVWREFLNLLIPTNCELCNRSGWSICDPCLSSLGRKLQLTSRHHLEGYRLVEYAEPVTGLIRKFKEQGVTELAHRWCSDLDFCELLERFEFDEILPIPSSRTSNIARGFSPAAILAREFRSALKTSAKLSRGLSRVGAQSDQAGLALSERWQNVNGSFAAKHMFEGRRVLLVDDIVTTGASLLEAARAVEAAGGQVVGFFCFAETVLRHPKIEA